MSWAVFAVAVGYVVALLLVWLIVTGAIRVHRDLRERGREMGREREDVPVRRAANG